MLAAATLLALAGDPAWVGSWRGPDGEALVLEPDRAARLRGGEARYFRLEHAGNRVRLERWAKTETLVMTLDGDTMRVEFEGEVTTYARQGAPDPRLRVEAEELPHNAEPSAEVVAEVVQELARRVAEDQRVRRLFDTEGVTDALREECRRVDEDNTAYLWTTIRELGWIDATRFGAAASNDAFLIVQHSPDLVLQRTALPFIEEDVRAKRLNGQAFALLYDRYHLNIGRKQRYGSQVGTLADGSYALMPCEHRERVDELRAEFGMQPLERYLAYWGTAKPIPDLADALGALQ